MHDEELLYYSLKRIASTIERIINNSKSIDDSQYYVCTPAGMERLESTCMLLLAIGESIKGIDKMTQKQLLPNYPDVDWKGAMGIRDIIAHHYFDIDESIVYDVVKNKLPGMLETINKIIEEILIICFSSRRRFLHKILPFRKEKFLQESERKLWRHDPRGILCHGNPITR